MPGTQRPYRPYLYNFLTAFRAHHAFRSATASASSPATSTAAAFAAQQQQQQQQQHHQQSPAQQHQQTTGYSSAAGGPPTSSAPWPIPHKSAPAAHTPLPPTSAVSAAFSPPSPHHRHAHAAATAATSPVGGGPATAGFGANTGNGRARAGRRGSDASSDGGFRERGGGEAWFVGGKTAAGEERFYRLGMARRERSGERASVDRMSL